SKRQGFGSPFNLTLRPPANAEHCSQAGVSTFYPSKDKFYLFIEGPSGISGSLVLSLSMVIRKSQLTWF
ncbi:hypothetical protein AAK899_03945, partial [Erysipelotrichaceae bacterium 51-3]